MCLQRGRWQQPCLAPAAVHPMHAHPERRRGRGQHGRGRGRGHDAHAPALVQCAAQLARLDPRAARPPAGWAIGCGGHRQHCQHHHPRRRRRLEQREHPSHCRRGLAVPIHAHSRAHAHVRAWRWRWMRRRMQRARATHPSHAATAEGRHTQKQQQRRLHCDRHRGDDDEGGDSRRCRPSLLHCRLQCCSRAQAPVQPIGLQAQHCPCPCPCLDPCFGCRNRRRHRFQGPGLRVNSSADELAAAPAPAARLPREREQAKTMGLAPAGLLRGKG